MKVKKKNQNAQQRIAKEDRLKLGDSFSLSSDKRYTKLSAPK